MEQQQSSNVRSKYTLRTSDRRTFRRCFRKWDYISSMRQNLQRKGTEQNINFWFGSGIHFAMEDYHGYNVYGDPRRAFYAYYNAFKNEERPEGADTAYGLGIDMLTYYLTWYERHNKDTVFETLWLNEKDEPVPANTPGGHPCVEQKFFAPLNVKVIVDTKRDQFISIYIDGTEGIHEAYRGMGGYLDEIPTGVINRSLDADNNVIGVPEMKKAWHWYSQEGYVDVSIVPIYYHGTMDRLVVDKFNRIWILDYKTAKSADTNKLDTDDQISAYLWAANKILKLPVYGFIYLQLTKEAIKEPKRKKNGQLSVDKKQHTTYGLVKKEIIKDYGAVSNAPNDLIEFLNILAEKEMPEGDRFIRWDFIKRNNEQLNATQRAIYDELEVMLNPDVVCFPNPTRDCIWDCPVREACIAQDKGENDTLFEFFKDWEKRPRDEDGNGNTDAWRNTLLKPKDVAEVPMEEILESKSLEFNTEEDEPEDTFKFMYEDGSEEHV